MSLLIENISLPPKTLEVSNIHSAENTKHYNEEQQVAAQFQQVVKQNSETAVRRREVDNDELKNEERKNKQNNQRKHESKDRNKKEDSGKEKNLNMFEGNLFDMKI